MNQAPPNNAPRGLPQVVAQGSPHAPVPWVLLMNYGLHASYRFPVSLSRLVGGLDVC